MKLERALEGILWILVSLSLLAFLAAVIACRPVVDPALTLAEDACVVEAGTKPLADACRRKVRLTWAKAHDASSLVDAGALAKDGARQ